MRIFYPDNDTDTMNESEGPLDRDDSFEETNEQQTLSTRILKTLQHILLEYRKNQNDMITLETNKTETAFQELETHNRKMLTNILKYINTSDLQEITNKNLREQIENALGPEMKNPGSWPPSARVEVKHMIETLQTFPFTHSSEHLQILQEST